MKTLSLSVGVYFWAGFLALGFMPNPDLLTISPAVAKAGTSVEVTIKGKHLDEAENLRFTHAEIIAKPVVLPADDLHPEPRPVAGRFTVTVPAEVEPGIYEVRARGYFGLSTARPFVVLAADSTLAAEDGSDHSTRESALPLEIETGMIGTLDSGKFDWYRFSAKKGERILVHLWAERIDSRADGLLAVFDVRGRELDSSRHHFGRDPFVDFTAPEDGEYFLSLTDSLYLGGSEFFYFLKASRNPHIDFVFPPAGLPGEKRRFTLFGRNLPGGSLGEGWKWNGKEIETRQEEIAVPAEVMTLPGFHWGIPRQGMVPAFVHRVENSNPVRIGFAAAPVAIEEPSMEEQLVTVPTEIAGRFDEAGDSDAFRFSAKKGATYWVDVLSHRLGVTADPVVIVEKISKADSGEEETFSQVLEIDDLPSFYGRDSLDDLNADSLDPAGSFTAEEDSEYRVTVVNQSANGSPAHLYRLAIREALPDYQLIVGTELTKTINNDAFPNAPLIRRNGSMIFRVMAFRQDGFDGEITVAAEELPEGVLSEPLVMSGDTREGFLTLWAAPDAPAWSGPIRISGVAEIGGRSVERTARSASILWGKRVFGNQSQVRSRLDGEVVLSVMDSEADPTRIQAAEDREWEVAVNETLEIPFQVSDTGPRVGNLQVNAHGFPGLHRSPPATMVAEGATEGKLTFTFRPSGNFEVTPGRYQFVLQGIGNRKYRHNPAAAERAESEVKRLDSREKSLAAEVETLRTELKEREKQRDAARQKAEGAANDAERSPLEEVFTRAEAAVAAGKESLAAAETLLAKISTTKASAAKAAKAATDLAKEKSNQFATYSQPITVVVTPVPEAK